MCASPGSSLPVPVPRNLKSTGASPVGWTELLGAAGSALAVTTQCDASAANGGFLESVRRAVVLLGVCGLSSVRDGIGKMCDLVK